MLLLAASYACSCFPMPLCLCWRPYRYSHWRPGQQQLCHGASASSIFPMLPHCLPCRVSRGAATLPHRLPLRSIPPPRFACGSSHSRGHGRPRSVRKSSRPRGKCLSMDCIYPQDCICSDITNLSAHLHRLSTPPPYLRPMRLSPGRGVGVGCWIWLLLGQGRSSSKSPRARILVLGTSGAH